MHEAGKGSRPRPFSVTQQEYDTRWDAIFCRDLTNEIKEEYRVNNLGQTERFFEGQWVLDTKSKND